MNVDALNNLARAIEAGEKMETVLVSRELFGLHDRRNLLKAADGSLDAAMALHKAVLPGWRVKQVYQLGSRHWYAAIHHPQNDDWPKWTQYPLHEAANPDPARAWLLAIVRALAAQATE